MTFCIILLDFAVTSQIFSVILLQWFCLCFGGKPFFFFRKYDVMDHIPNDVYYVMLWSLTLPSKRHEGVVMENDWCSGLPEQRKKIDKKE